MHIATVIPIERGVPFDALSYYCNDPLKRGTLVLIPFGKQQIYGFVTHTTSLADAKAYVKQAAFSLKKVKQVLGHVSFFEKVINALTSTGVSTLAPIGSVSGFVLPSILFEYVSAEKISEIFPNNNIKEDENSFEEKIVSGQRLERVDEYKRIIRTSFAEKRSVLFIAPTIRSLEWWKKELERGIARHTAIFHSRITKKELRANFSMLKQQEVPLLIFSTPQFSVLPIRNTGTIIVEDESSNLYRSNDRFEIDARIFLKNFAKQLGNNLFWGDMIPRFETLHNCNSAHFPRTFVPEKLHIVPIDQYRTVLPSETIELIRHCEKKRKKLFIFTNRKGLAPLSRCGDCGTVVTCDECNMPMALRNRRNGDTAERFFVCLHCAHTLPSNHLCAYCHSWNIKSVSIGTESIRDAVSKIIDPNIVFAIDDELTPDDKTINQLIKNADEKKFAVFIGTQKALPYLKKVSYSIMPFFDRLISTPSIYTNEQILRLVMECNEFSSDGVIICTKIEEFPFIKLLKTQKINTIIKEELDLRKDLGYPPFGALVKISMTVPEGYRKQVADDVSGYFHNIEHTLLPPRRISSGSTKILLTWLIKVGNDYIEEEGGQLTSFLESLRYPFKIQENPERL